MKQRKKSKELSKKKDQLPLPPKHNLVKFNLSYENLKCFIKDRYPKTQRKRPSNKYQNNRTDEKRSNQDSQNDIVEVTHTIIRRQLSPDPSRQASNLIIEQIQKKGVKCTWNDQEIEEPKNQFSYEKQWQEGLIINEAFSQRSSSFGKNSHASTIDRFPVYYTQQLQNYANHHLIMNDPKEFLGQPVMANSEYMIDGKLAYFNCNSFEINPLSIGHDPRTTLMVRNIPNKYTIQDLSYEIDHNFANSYDFLYLPCDIKNNCNVGYGFINFLNTEILFQFYKRFHNKRWIKFRSDKICVLTYARLQGLSSLIEHFQNSKVLNHKDKRYKPIIKDIDECKRIQSLIKQQQSLQSFTDQSTNV